MNLDTLYDAAIAGDADARTKLLMQADILNEYGETILHVESERGNTERVKFMLREFANRNLLVKLSKYKHTALHLAASYGHTEVVEVLIEAARHLPSSSANDDTSFQAFLRQGDIYMDTALHLAADCGHVDIVKLIVEADPTDRHIQNNKGKTPMYIAVEKGYNDIVEIISTTCIAPSLDGPDGSTVVRIDNLDQVESPGGTLYKIKDRYADAIAGDADAIAKLEMEADKLDENENTILHTEAKNGNAERVQFILRQFPNKNLLTKINHINRTALHLAVYNGHTEVAEFLIHAARDLPPSSFQAFLRQGDFGLDTALHAAVMEGNVDIVKLLVEADPTDRHIQNHKGKTPMYIAVERGYNHIVEIISTTCISPSLDGPHGSTVVRINDIDQVKSPGGTLYKIISIDAVYAAAIAGDADAIAKLEMLADILNDQDETILHIAVVLGGELGLVQYILRELAHKNLLAKLTKKKNTALHYAASYGSAEVVKVLIDAARNLPSSSSTNNQTDDNSVSPFQAFLRQGNKDLLTALHNAVRKRDVALVEVLVKADPSDRHIQDSEGQTPIYLAAERGYFDMVKIMCTTCTVPINLDGPGSTTALHAVIKNLDKDKKEKRDLIRLIINAVKIEKMPEDAEGLLPGWGRDERLVQLFKKTDEDRCTILELAVERNYGDVVELLLAENPAYQNSFFAGRLDHDKVGLLPLIYNAGDKEYRDVLELLNQRLKRLPEVTFPKGNMAPLLNAIRSHNLEKVLRQLDKNDTKVLVTFIDDVGWTALHHAAYHELHEVIKRIVEAQKKFGHEFVYPDKRPTPFHVAAQKGFTSTVILLLQLWPSSSSAYIAIDKNGQNILHLAALQSEKEMMQAIFKYCPEEYKKELVNKKDNNGNTPLHVLIRRGCFVPELLRYQGLDTTVENKNRWTPIDMLYVEDEIIDDQVKIKIALDDIQIDQKRDLFSSSELSISKREEKDAIMKKKADQMIHQMHARMKGDTRAFANCFADAIAGDPISKAALGMEADTLQEEGKTILHVESMNGVTERVECILREFAIKNLLVKLDISKQTALHLAAHHGHTQVVKVLIEAARHLPSSSANDDTHNPIRSFQDFIRRTDSQMGNTALHLAVLNGDVAIVKLIVDADPNDRHVQNNEGKTPIYIAAENGYKDMVKEICTTCTALSLDGPGGRTTALHALVQSITGQGVSDVIRIMVNAAKRWSTSADFEALFSRTDESESTVLQLAVEKNNVDAVRLILQEDPAYQQGGEIKRNGLMRLIYKAIDKNCSDDIIKVLSQTYEAGIIDPDYKDVLSLILAIKSRDEDSVLRLLGGAKALVTFTEDNGWTPLHYAVYHEFDSVLGAIIGAQEDVEHQFMYGNRVPTPFHVAVEFGYSSTLILLMQLWPASSDESVDADSPYTTIDENDRNILHLAALAETDNKKEMVQGILKYCPKKYKDEILKQQDINGDTPLHLLISNGCFIPELIKDEGLDTMAKNNISFTPWEMLYFQNDVVANQVEIKIAIDDVQTNTSAWKFWAKSTEKKTDIWKRIPQSKRRIKDVIFNERKKVLMHAKQEEKKTNLEKYKMRTNTQIIVTALITTITFTVGFTMPGGLRQSGEVDEGLVLLSKKSAFNAFMVSDALALLLSTSSLFFYFLESMSEDPHQVAILNAASTVLNIVSVMAMMLTFIAGTYLVLSNSPVLAITVSIIGSLFFLLTIILLIKIVYDRLHVKRNLD